MAVKPMIVSNNRAFKNIVYKVNGIYQPSTVHQLEKSIHEAKFWHNLTFSAISSFHNDITTTIKYVYEPHKEFIAVFLIFQYYSKGKNKLNDEALFKERLQNLFSNDPLISKHPYHFELLPDDKARMICAMRQQYVYGTLVSKEITRKRRLGFHASSDQIQTESADYGLHKFALAHLEFFNAMRLPLAPQELSIHLRMSETLESDTIEFDDTDEYAPIHPAQLPSGPHLIINVWSGYSKTGRSQRLPFEILRKHFALGSGFEIREISERDLAKALEVTFEYLQPYGNTNCVQPGAYPWFAYLPFPEIQPSGFIFTFKSKPKTTLPHNDEMIKLGHRKFGRKRQDVMLNKSDLARHVYVIGQTGVGKTTFLKQLIAEIDRSMEGYCVIDPHGDLIDSLMVQIPAGRKKDVVLIDPGQAHSARFNILEYDRAHPEQRTFLINSLLEIINSQYDMRLVGGPMFELYFVNAVKLELENEIPSFDSLAKLFSDVDYLKAALKLCKDKRVVNFFSGALQTTGEGAFHNFGPYIMSKLNKVIEDDYIYPILSAPSGIRSFRKLIDTNAIILVNLRQGLMSREAASFLGAIVLQKIIYAAKSRHNQSPQTRKPFTLFIDEFQNFVNSELGFALAEVRKYNLRMVLANQNLYQLSDTMLHAILGNVASTIFFRVGVMDANHLEPYIAPFYSKEDLLYLPNFSGIARVLQNNEPQKPFLLNINVLCY